MSAPRASLLLRRLVPVLLALSTPLVPRAAGADRALSRDTLADKIRGGWAGQMIGVAYGAPTEFKAKGRILEDEPGNFTAWNRERVRNALGQDDLYVEMTFVRVIEQCGLEATSAQYADAFMRSEYGLWHANAAARRLLRRGVKPPESGHPSYNAHADDIDFQIESDFIGLMSPGLPQEANRVAQRVGCLMNYGDGLYGGMFVSGMYAAAFFDRDPRRIVAAGLASIPPASTYAQLIRDVLAWSAEHPNDWRATWQLLEDKWDRNDVCPNGALQPYNIDAKLNGGYLALGLLYGNGDFARTLEITTRAGQDSDCNPSSAAGILGVALGYSGIPAPWKDGLEAIADAKFQFTDYSVNDVARLTLTHALGVITRAGGKIDGDTLTIPRQAAVPPRLEQWRPGIPDRIIPVSARAWEWSGPWTEQLNKEKSAAVAKIARGKGSAAELQFDGVGVFLTGRLDGFGGRATVYIDGETVGEIDAFAPPRTFETDLWHAYGLTPGKHLLRIVTRDDHDSESKGNDIEIRSAIVLKPYPKAPMPGAQTAR